MEKKCNTCGFTFKIILFKKRKISTDGYSNICKKCTYHKNYLNKYKDGFYYKKCNKHGILDYENISIIKRKDRGKYQIMLRCSLCFNDWQQNNIKNEDLMNERIDLNIIIICKVCKTNYGHECFNKSELKKKNSICKNCWKNWQEKYEHKVSISRKFKFTRDQYNELWHKQSGLCAICQLPESAKENGKVRRLSTDHCHKIQEQTGETAVRGLLCAHCNNGLGRFKDNINILINAIKYLECFNEKS